MISITREQPQHGASIEALYDTCFGVDRYTKSSYALRSGAEPLSNLARVAIDRDQRASDGGDMIVAAVRFWPVAVQCLVSGRHVPALLLGPFAVDPEYQGQKIGQAMMWAALDNAESEGHGLILLVGDQRYYQRFGFIPARPKTITLPGRRDADRLLVRKTSGLIDLPSVGVVQPSRHQKVAQKLNHLGDELTEELIVPRYRAAS